MRAMRHNAGFSLIEVVVAILVLGIALVGLTEGITTALGSSKESELQTTAALFAAGRIEELRAAKGLIDGEREGDCGEGLALYRWKQSIRGAGIDGLHEVAVVVENARSGRSIYELRTLLFQLPEEPTAGASGNRRDATSQNGQGGRQ